MQTEAFGAELKRMGFCDFVGVPCSYLAPLINWAINENVFVMANNEGEAVAIASGVSLSNSSSGNHCADLLDFESSQTLQSSSLPKSSKNHTSTTANTRIVESSKNKHSPSLAEGVRGWVDSTKTESTNYSRGSIFDEKSGLRSHERENKTKASIDEASGKLHDFSQKDNARKYGVVLMQNSGLSNALSPLTSLNHTFEIPILGFVSLRGEPNEAGQNTDEPQHELLGKITDTLLQTCQIECAFLDSRFEVACEQLAQAHKVLESNKSFFFIVRKSCFEKVALTNNPLSNSSLTQSSREFEKSSLDRPLVLSRSDFPAQPTNLTQDTRIADFVESNADSNDFKNSPSLSTSGVRGWVDSTNELRGSILVEKSGLCQASNEIEQKGSSRKRVQALHDFNPKDSAQKPTRLEALSIIQNLGNDCALLATTGKCGRELYELGDRPNQLYMVGSMGCVSALGLGIALKSRKKVIAIDGDSALLMRLGTLSGNAYYANVANKGNLCHILLDNQSHDSTGGQFNLSPFVDFVAIAKSCGYAVAKEARNLSEFSAILGEFVSAKSGGAWFIYLQIAKGSKKDLGRPKITPKQVALRFGEWLNENLECADTHKL